MQQLFTHGWGCCRGTTDAQEKEVISSPCSLLLPSVPDHTRYNMRLVEGRLQRPSRPQLLSLSRRGSVRPLPPPAHLAPCTPGPLAGQEPTCEDSLATHRHLEVHLLALGKGQLEQGTKRKWGREWAFLSGSGSFRDVPRLHWRATGGALPLGPLEALVSPTAWFIVGVLDSYPHPGAFLQVSEGPAVALVPLGEE